MRTPGRGYPSTQQIPARIAQRLDGEGTAAPVLDLVLVTPLFLIELALESGPPGKVSVEHVVNVLNRLNAQPVAPTAATLLKVTTPPLTNTARYDSLRSDTVVVHHRGPRP